MTQEAQIAALIEKIAKRGEQPLRFPVMSGKVVSIDAGDMTVSVSLGVDMDVDDSGNVNDGIPNEGVTLNVALNNTGGMYALPAAGAYCIVAEIDGPGRWELLRASAYSRIVMQASGTIQLNDGGLGALPVLDKIESNLQKLSDYIKSTLEPAINTALNAVGVGSAASGTAGATSFNTSVGGATITFDDMANGNITQG